MNELASNAVLKPSTELRSRPRLIGECAVVALLLVAYDRIRALAHVQRDVALNHGFAILGLEHDFRMEVERGLNRWLTAHELVGHVAVDYYQYVHVIAAMTLLIACYVLRPHAYRPARNALLLINAVGLAAYALFPVAPPRLLPGTDFVDTVARAGFGMHHSGVVAMNPYGAMPSLHVAWAVWVLLVGFAITESVWLRCLFIAHPVITAFVVVATANHYALDVVMGTVLAIVSIVVARPHATARRAFSGRSTAECDGAPHEFRPDAVRNRRDLVEQGPRGDHLLLDHQDPRDDRR
jgi:hypothetical protein